MNIIRFSHNYPKLHSQTSAELLAVNPIRIDRSTPAELLAYDTHYETPNGVGAFKLPTGDYIQLIFVGNLRIPFSTIRPAWPPTKKKYYKSKIGETFAIIVGGTR